MTDDETAFVAILAGLLAAAGEEESHVAAYYAALRKTTRLRDVLLAEVRCAQRGCALLTVFHTPGGPAFVQKRYKLSASMNAATSSASGRTANTEDGDNHWRARSGMVARAVNFTLECDHTRLVLEKADLALGAPGRPTRRVV